MKIAKFISICIFITFCSCNNKGVYENCISFKLTDFLDKGEIKGTDLQFSKEVMRPTALHIEDSILILKKIWMNIYCICIMLIQERKLTHLFLLEMALENFFIYNKYNHLTAYYGYQMHKDHSYLLIVKKTSYFQILYHQQQ